MGKKLLTAFIAALVLTTCGTNKDDVNSAIAKDYEQEGLQPIDIRSPDFFMLLQPWRDGKLVTFDGWARYAEISFIGANRMEIRHLVEFPRRITDRRLLTWPEAGLIASQSNDMRHHLAAIDDRITKSHVPFMTWVYTIPPPVLLDSNEGLVGYGYISDYENNINTRLFVYNYKEDRMIYESPSGGFNVRIFISMNSRYMLANQRNLVEGRMVVNNIFYDWRTGEVVENDLTRALNQNRIDLIIRSDKNIRQERRFLFGYSNIIKERVKITWNEEYSDITIIPLSYLVPRGRRVDDFTFSADGRWATSLISGYEGLFNENLCKRAFFHIDDRYPNGISMPVITEDYEEYQWDYSAFVQHPVHGLCCAQEWHKIENGKDVQYLRLYRMDDVLAEINRALAGAE
jgi:hypothetical protein